MVKKIIDVGEDSIIVLMSDELAAADEGVQALWLIAPEGMDAQTWEKETEVLAMAEDAKAILVCLPGKKSEDFYSKKVWSVLHENFGCLSDAPRSHRLLGLGTGACMCLKLVFKYPELFNVVVGVSPVADEKDEIVKAVEEYGKRGIGWPRTVIADTPDGAGKNIGDAINEFGVGMHVHSERTEAGWKLMGSEVKSCLAHL